MHEIEDYKTEAISNRTMNKYEPKQLNLDKLFSLEKEEKDFYVNLIQNNTNMFHEEIKATVVSKGLIIDQRESNINSLLKED